VDVVIDHGAAIIFTVEMSPCMAWEFGDLHTVMWAGMIIIEHVQMI